jgi:hypothetical protein
VQEVELAEVLDGGEAEVLTWRPARGSGRNATKGGAPLLDFEGGYLRRRGHAMIDRGARLFPRVRRLPIAAA